MNRVEGELPLWALVQSHVRDDIEKFLNERNIYPLKFPLPLHTAEYFDNVGEFPNATKFAAQGLRLPCGPTQNLSNVNRVIEAIVEFTHQ